MFRNVFCHQSAEGIIEDSLCTEDVAGEKPTVAKTCDEEEGSEEESSGQNEKDFLLELDAWKARNPKKRPW